MPKRPSLATCSPIDTCVEGFSSRVALTVATILLVLVQGHPSFGQTTFSGEHEFYAAVGFNHQPDPLAVRNRLRLRGRYATSQMMAYVALRGSSALSDPQKGGEPGPFRGRVLESFIDLYFAHVDVRIGHQLIVWGQMDGVFITDVVSPLDLTEFLAQDFTDIRLAVPAIKASYYLGDWSVTGLLVVTAVTSPIPGIESPWFVVPNTAASLDISVGPDNLPNPRDGELEPGLRISYNGSGTSVDVIYLYGYNRIPALAKAVAVDTDGVLGVTISPDYFRRHVVGSRISSSFLPELILEAEVAYESVIKVDADPNLLVDARGLASLTDDLLIRQGHLLGGISLARSFGQTFLRTQLVGSFLTRSDDRTARSTFREAATLFVRSTWSNETFGGQVFLYYNPGGDFWLNPSLTYGAAPGLNLFVGGHLFGGDPSAGAFSTSAFGLFDENDFAYLRATLAF